MIPFLFLGDSPDRHSGLARIGRSLAHKLSLYDKYKVGYLGVNGVGTSKLKFEQYFCNSYNIGDAETGRAMGDVLPRVWRDFSGDKGGILFAICEPSWLLWLACPEYARATGYGALADFLERKDIHKWLYAIIDAEGPHSKLCCVYNEILAGFDKIAVPSVWACGLANRSMNGHVPSAPIEYLPHGIDTEVFHKLDSVERRLARISLNFEPKDFVVGTVMTNQPRKDWALAGAIAFNLRQQIPNLKLWWHVDRQEAIGGWSLPAIINDFALNDIVHVTIGGTDDDMCRRYNACDVTMLPSNGEGFGYPILESQACGVPCVHVAYGGGEHYTPANVVPYSFRFEGLFNSKRPVTSEHQWAEMVKIGNLPTYDMADYSWEKVWPKWHSWLEA